MNSKSKIFMEDRGCNPVLLRKLYVEQSKSLRDLGSLFNVTGSVVSRWLKESDIEKRKSYSKYKLNSNYFDCIDTPEKAYWIGFIWCDGYVLKRTRQNNVTEYSFKLSLSEKDEDHLYKFKECLDADTPIYTYELNKDAFASEHKESRFRTSNVHLGKTLYNSYGLIPNRVNTGKLINKVPSKYSNHFIRGIYDAEGSVSVYYHQKDGNYKPALKMGMSFTTYYELLDYIQNHFIEAGVKTNKISTEQRHKDRDQHCLSLKYSGATQVPEILDYLYEDATVYLERKFKKYQDIKLIQKERGK